MADNRAESYRILREFLSDKARVGPTLDEWMAVWPLITNEVIANLDAIYATIENCADANTLPAALDAYNGQLRTLLVGNPNLQSAGKESILRLMNLGREEVGAATRFSEIVNLIKSKAQGNQRPRNSSDVKTSFRRNLELGIDYDVVEPNFFKTRATGHSQCRAWFNAFNQEERAAIMTRINTMRNGETKTNFLAHCVLIAENEGRRAVLVNKFQIVYPLMSMIYARKAQISDAEFRALVTRISGISQRRPMSKFFYNHMVTKEPLMRRLNGSLHNGRLDIHSHAHLINSSRFLEGVLMLGGGVCSMAVTCVDATLNQIISLIYRLSGLEDISDERDSTSTTEHMVHMTCLVQQGDGLRMRNGFRHGINQVRVVIEPQVLN